MFDLSSDTSELSQKEMGTIISVEDYRGFVQKFGAFGPGQNDEMPGYAIRPETGGGGDRGITKQAFELAGRPEPGTQVEYQVRSDFDDHGAQLKSRLAVNVHPTGRRGFS